MSFRGERGKISDKKTSPKMPLNELNWLPNAGAPAEVSAPVVLIPVLYEVCWGGGGEGRKTGLIWVVVLTNSCMTFTCWGNLRSIGG